ncbi:anaphase-promoting complex subunit 2 [Homalodisca vitripennis]|nr:anaphase-promoting complex subunit 2 [Homalodisca vitripennis]
MVMETSPDQSGCCNKNALLERKRERFHASLTRSKSRHDCDSEQRTPGSSVVPDATSAKFLLVYHPARLTPNSTLKKPAKVATVLPMPVKQSLLPHRQSQPPLSPVVTKAVQPITPRLKTTDSNDVTYSENIIDANSKPERCRLMSPIPDDRSSPLSSLEPDVEEAVTVLSRQPSVGSLTDWTEDQVSLSEQVLLEQCITSGMPKTKNGINPSVGTTPADVDARHVESSDRDIMKESGDTWNEDTSPTFPSISLTAPLITSYKSLEEDPIKPEIQTDSRIIQLEAGKTQLMYMGHIFSDIVTDPVRVRAIEEFLTLKTVRSYGSFLGLVSWCRSPKVPTIHFVAMTNHIALKLKELSSRRASLTTSANVAVIVEDDGLSQRSTKLSFGKWKLKKGPICNLWVPPARRPDVVENHDSPLAGHLDIKKANEKRRRHKLQQGKCISENRKARSTLSSLTFCAHCQYQGVYRFILAFKVTYSKWAELSPIFLQLVISIFKVYGEILLWYTPEVSITDYEVQFVSKSFKQLTEN